MKSHLLPRLTGCALLVLIPLMFTLSPVRAEGGPGQRDFVTGLLMDSDFASIFQAMSKYFPQDAQALEASLRRTADQLGVDRAEVIPTENVTRMSEPLRVCRRLILVSYAAIGSVSRAA